MAVKVDSIVVVEPTDAALSRVAAARELLRLERRIARAEQALKVLLAHREALLAAIGRP